MRLRYRFYPGKHASLPYPHCSIFREPQPRRAIALRCYSYLAQKPPSLDFQCRKPQRHHIYDQDNSRRVKASTRRSIRYWKVCLHLSLIYSLTQMRSSTFWVAPPVDEPVHDSVDTGLKATSNYVELEMDLTGAQILLLPVQLAYHPTRTNQNGQP